MRITLFADIIVPLSVPNLYTYRIPAEWNELAVPGKRVIIQFGKSKFYTGIIRRVHETPPKYYEAKYIESIVDDEPVVTEVQLNFWEWIAFYYICYPGEVMNAALPAGLKLNSETRIALNPERKDQEIFDLKDNEFIIVEALRDGSVLTIQQLAALLNVKNAQPALKRLQKENIIQVFEELKQKYQPKKINYIKLNEAYKSDQKLGEIIEKLEKKAYKQLEALLFYITEEQRVRSLPIPEEQKQWVKKSELVNKSDSSAVNALIKKGILDEMQIETGRLEFMGETGRLKTLNETQQIALGEIRTVFNEKNVCLLHGVTGSGKTEIYLHLIEEQLKQGKQVLYLVPEIALTTQLIFRIQHCFGARAGVYHSKFSENERVEIWNGVLQEHHSSAGFNHRQYDLIIGARSSLFLPFRDLGLIIIDEEHDASFKQHDPAPRYHARDAAVYLSTLHNAKVLMGSATPAIDTYYLSQSGKYGLVELKDRHGNAKMPQLTLVNLREENKRLKRDSIFSEVLLQRIREKLEKKEQTILFQNRRGFAPVTECRTCGWVPHCIQCDVSLIYHKHSGKLTCHYCGYITSPPAICSACGSSDLRYRNYGTEKIEEELELILPDARIARMDLDSTRSKYAYTQLINDFEDGNIDVLVGTQMVTKGLDFDRVSLVGVLNADQLLNYPDFRAFERAYQLLTQVSGRAGRKEIPGEVIIQTSQVDHPVLADVIRGDYLSFYKQQLAEREAFNYPPFYRVMEFTVSDSELNLVNNAADFVAVSLRTLYGKRVLGPEFPLVSRVRNRYLKRVLLKLERNVSATKLRDELFRFLEEFRTHNDFKRVRLMVDVDPV